MKTFFSLAGPYEGLRVRRLDIFGRIWLCKVINDLAPYYFVTIRNFDSDKDLQRINAKSGNGTFRFVRAKDAQAKFAELKRIPAYVADEEKRQTAAQKNSDRMLSLNIKSKGLQNDDAAS